MELKLPILTDDNIETEITFEFDNDFLNEIKENGEIETFLEKIFNKKIIPDELFDKINKLEKVFLNKKLATNFFKNIIKSNSNNLKALKYNDELIQDFFKFNYEHSYEYAFGLYAWILNENEYDIEIEFLPDNIIEIYTENEGAEFETGKASFLIGTEDFFYNELLNYYEDLIENDIKYGISTIDDLENSYLYNIIENYSNIDDLIEEFMEEEIKYRFETYEEEYSDDNCFINRLHEYLYDEGIISETCCEDNLDNYQNDDENMDEEELKDKCKEEIENMIDDNRDEYMEKLLNKILYEEHYNLNNLISEFGIDIIKQWFDNDELIIDYDRYTSDNLNYGELNNWDGQYFEYQYEFDGYTYDVIIVRKD